MTLPPLPPKKGVLPPGSPGIGKSTKAKPVVRREDIQPASVIPVIIASSSLALSAMLALIFRNSTNVIIGVVGYLLAPFLIILMSGVDAVWQRKSSASKPWFLPKPRYATILRILSAFSLVVAYFHIDVMASYLSIQLGKLLS